ncbi:MAG: acyl-CoA dehydrogenase family protein [Deltaproteobacteria bacterium]|nr:acyl-CoA dehydrogenase family protein [Deltaproteobacteria bacterium]
MTQTDTTCGAGFLLGDAAPEDVFTPEDFSAEQLLYAKTARDFMRNEVLPVSDRIEAKDFGLVRDLLRKAGELGLLMADVPEEYGGLALDKASGALIAENISGQGSFQTILSGHTGIGSLPLVYYGSQALQARYLPDMAVGAKIGCYALTEPAAGSDALACRTKAVLSADGAHYVLNGTKQFITNAGFADLFTVFAKVDGQHFTGFLLERETPGLSVGPEEHKMGLKGSSTTTVILDDARVPVENVLGQVGQGHKIAFNILNIGRFKIGAGAVGQGKWALEYALAYCLERKQFGKRIAEFGAIREKLAEMFVRLYSAEAATYRTIGLIDRLLQAGDGAHGEAALRSIEEYNLECAAVKVVGSEVLGYVVDEAVQCFGGYGYCAEYPVEALYRDSRIARIYEGTNEINRLLIATQLLRRAGRSQLPLLEAAAEVERALAESTTAAEQPSSGPVATEATLVATLKRVLLLCLKAVAESSQTATMVPARLADLFALVYVAESTRLRAAKDAARRGVGRAAGAVAAARITCESAQERAESLARQVLVATGRRDLLAGLGRLTAREPADVLALKELIAARLVEAERWIV